MQQAVARFHLPEVRIISHRVDSNMCRPCSTAEHWLIAVSIARQRKCEPRACSSVFTETRVSIEPEASSTENRGMSAYGTAAVVKGSTWALLRRSGARHRSRLAERSSQGLQHPPMRNLRRRPKRILLSSAGQQGAAMSPRWPSENLRRFASPSSRQKPAAMALPPQALPYAALDRRRGMACD